jgi:hypothetical protein
VAEQWTSGQQQAAAGQALQVAVHHTEAQQQKRTSLEVCQVSGLPATGCLQVVLLWMDLETSSY